MELPPQEPLLPSDPSVSLDSFDRRIIRQTREVYEALPEVVGMHFTQVDQLGSITGRGFIEGKESANYFYVFDKKETDEHFGPKLGRADKAGLDHYDVKATIKRFHAAFVDGLMKYGIEKLPELPVTLRKEVRDYLLSNKEKMPAVIFADLSKEYVPRKEKSDKKLSQGYADDLDDEHVIDFISIDPDDFDEITADVERGISLEDSCKKILVNKTVEWLLLRSEEHKIELAKIRDQEYVEEIKKNPLSEWRKSLDEEFGPETVDKIITVLREREDIRTGDKAIRVIDGVEYLTQSAITQGRFILNIIRGKKEFSSLVSGYAVENKMLAESLPVHSFGGVELIKLAKCKAAELLKFEGNSRFGRPLESIIYFGSLDDIELPLLAGVKEIYLVDPGLEEAVIEHLISRVKHYGKNVSYDETKKVLTFDLESRSVVTRLFQETMQEFNQREAIKVEGVLMFNKAPGMEKAEAEKALLPNGFCLDNKNH